ncbi:putative Pancreatic triacylglycerol lipase [Hypsibius exemplaris]|uniref:Pancreatic triacylglycerol lipase n=1 Tax=Hypsibius exemplaris TaxID=2072580 RepID=A0A1W0WY22_HYPEX|nr:putative Pancreatic triacylglycerol lipase [Hypsibius exemplaris]
MEGTSAQTSRLVLNTRVNPSPSGSTVVDITSPAAATLRSCPFSAARSTKILIHGYLDKYDAPYWRDMMTEFLKGEDLNVFRLDWDASSLPPITQAATNAITVAGQVSQAIQYLKSAHNLNPATVHIIGHSLGGLVSGAIAQALREANIKVDRITGLDPAGQLSTGDATVVDTIVTTGAVPGSSRESIGHINFMPNGGQVQPGCGTTVCSHIKAMSLFTESINNQNVYSTQCPSYAQFLSGSCSNQPRAVFGYHVDLSLGRRSPVKLYDSNHNAQNLCATANAGRIPPVPC